MIRLQSNVYWRAAVTVELTECRMPFYYARQRRCSLAASIDVRKPIRGCQWNS
jgi:hypothetical protein